MARCILASALVLMHAALASAIIITPDLPQGLYIIPLDSTADPVRIETRPSHSRRRQINWLAGCGTNGQINIDEYAIAKENLKGACVRGETYQPHMAVVYTTGSSIAYFCNYGRRNQCSRAEYEDAMLSLVQQCGIGAGGEVTDQGSGKGYGGDNVGVEICI